MGMISLGTNAPLVSLRICRITCELGLILVVCGAAFGQAATQADGFDALASRAASARDGERLDEAVALYRQALQLRPGWVEGLWSLGTVEYDRNDYQTAAQDFEKLLPLVPKDGTARVMLGLCEFELGRDEASLGHIRDGLALGVADDAQLQQVALFHEGTLLLRGGQFKVAHTTFGQLCKMGNQSDAVMGGMGLAVLRILPRDADQVAAGSADVVPRIGHAACLSSLKKYDEADGEYEKLITAYPDFPNIHYAYGLSLVESSAIPKAVEQLQIEIHRNAKNVEARLEIAAALYKVDSVKALPYAQEAVALDPRLPFGHYLLGLLLLDTDQSPKAIPELEIAAKAFPKEKRIFFALGSAYSRAGRREDAAKARETFEKLNQASTGDASASY